MTKEITYDEIELMKEGVCDGCKGLFTLHETGCYERCEPFQEELKEARDQTVIEGLEALDEFEESGSRKGFRRWLKKYGKKGDEHGQ